MIENIFIGLIIVLAVGMGVWGWWIDNVGIKKKEEPQEEQKEENTMEDKKGQTEQKEQDGIQKGK